MSLETDAPAEYRSAQSVRHYRALAARYDHATRRINATRLAAIAQFGLQAGQTVVDVACGTGFCFAPIMRAIGDAGHLVAFDHSPELLAIAAQRVADAGWRNVTLLQASAQDVRFADRLDAAGIPGASAFVFSYTHDVLQSGAALANLFSQAARGARVLALGSRLFPAWLAPANWYMRYSHRHYITDMANFDRPWLRLATHLDRFTVRRVFPGERYVAMGALRDSA